MTGADYIKVPSQSQQFGQKPASELIGEDVTVQWTGIDGKVTGTIKHVDDYSELYGEEEKAGNFFPLELTTTGTELKSKNGEKEKTQPFPDDSLLVARIAQKTDKLEIEVDGKKIANLDFSGATLAQAAKIRTRKKL